MLETAKCYDSAEGKHYVMGYLKLSWNASLRHTERYVATDFEPSKNRFFTLGTTLRVVSNETISIINAWRSQESSYEDYRQHNMFV